MSGGHSSQAITDIEEEDVVRNCFARLALALAIAVLGIPGLLQAQGLTGQISGTVTDTTGGVLPGVTVTIRNVGTGLTRETVTGHRWRVPVSRPAGGHVRPDRHDAGVQDLRAEGHRARVRPNVSRLRAIALDVGGLSETVSVQSDAVQVQTTNGARSGLITRDTIEDIATQGPRLRRHCSSCCLASSTRGTVRRRAGRA